VLASLKRAALAAALLASACDDKPKDSVPSEPAGRPGVDLLGTVDASMLAEGTLATDPPAPAGDLKVELERFVNLDTCVAERAKLDPLVGDALGAIGYETLLRDACRLLEAAKDKKRESCAKVDSSPLRRQCESWVAMIAQTPDACPLQYDALSARGRVATCVAVAARDVRLCAGEGRANARATCEATVLHDPKRCEVLLPNPRAYCVRETTRWTNVLSSPLEGLPKLPIVSATLSLAEPDAGADAAAPVDLLEHVSNGVVLVTTRDRMRVELGSLIESQMSRIAAVPLKRARVGIALVGDGKSASIQKIEVVLPNHAPFVSPPASCDCKVTRFRAEPTRGTPVSLHLEGRISNATHQQPISIDVTTWVRDVVPDTLGGGPRTLPPIHPRRDGGP